MKTNYARKGCRVIKDYRIEFDLGEPVYSFPCGDKVVRYRWRQGKRTIAAYDAGQAGKRFAQPIIKRYGKDALINVHRVLRFDGKDRREPYDWTEVDLTAFRTKTDAELDLNERTK